MAHPSLSRKQATIVNIVALGTIAALVLAGLVASTSEESTQVGAATSVSPSTKIGLIDTKRIMAADEAPGDWLSYGRDYGEQRFSPFLGKHQMLVPHQNMNINYKSEEKN